MKDPHHTMVIWNWQGKVETIDVPRKTHANDNKRTKYIHACTNQLGNHACNLLPPSIPVEVACPNFSLLVP